LVINLAYFLESVVAIDDFFFTKTTKTVQKNLDYEISVCHKGKFAGNNCMYFDLYFISNAVSTVYTVHNQHVISFLSMSCSMFKYNSCDVVIISKRKLYLLECMVSMFSDLWRWYSREVTDLHTSKTSKWGKGLRVTGPCCRNSEL